MCASVVFEQQIQGRREFCWPIQTVDSIARIQAQDQEQGGPVVCGGGFLGRKATSLNRVCFLSCFLTPGFKASTPASQSTKDSGVGLQCPTLTPVGMGLGEGKPSRQEDPVSPIARGAPAAPRMSLQASPSSGGRSSRAVRSQTTEGVLCLWGAAAGVASSGSALTLQGTPQTVARLLPLPPS